MFKNSIPRELAGCLEDREDEKSLIAAEWLEANEDSDLVWSLIGDLLDTITEHANN